MDKQVFNYGDVLEGENMEKLVRICENYENEIKDLKIKVEYLEKQLRRFIHA